MVKQMAERQGVTEKERRESDGMGGEDEWYKS